MLGFKYIILLFSIVPPLGLDWNKKYELPPIVKDYKYYYGDVLSGPIVYVGTEDIIGTETELQLFFGGKRIAKAILILGPEGIDDHNCFKKYKTLIKLLNMKYGHYVYKRSRKEALMQDLVHSSKCYPLQVEMHDIRHKWRFNNFVIYADMFGDSEGLYIEVTFVNLKTEKTFNKETKRNILKKLSNTMKKKK